MNDSPKRIESNTAPDAPAIGYRSPVDDLSDRPTPTWGWSVLWRVIVYGGIVAVVVAALLPPIGRRRFSTQSIPCVSSIHQLIGLCFTYAQSNGGAFPPSIPALQGSRSAESFAKLTQCPDGNGAYIYLGAGTKMHPPAGTVLLYENRGTHAANPISGAVFGYGDGSVRFIPSPTAEKIIAELKAGHNPPRPQKIQ